MLDWGQNLEFMMSVQLFSVSQALSVSSEKKLWFCCVVMGYHKVHIGK
jgi:hypothetical protein